jgi:hypothetical protein
VCKENVQGCSSFVWRHFNVCVPVASAVQAPQPLAQPESHGSFCEFPAINPNMRGKPYRCAGLLSCIPSCCGSSNVLLHFSPFEHG